MELTLYTLGTYTALLEDGPVRPVRKPRPTAPKRRRR